MQQDCISLFGFIGWWHLQDGRGDTWKTLTSQDPRKHAMFQFPHYSERSSFWIYKSINMFMYQNHILCTSHLFPDFWVPILTLNYGFVCLFSFCSNWNRVTWTKVSQSVLSKASTHSEHPKVILRLFSTCVQCARCPVSSFAEHSQKLDRFNKVSLNSREA